MFNNLKSDIPKELCSVKHHKSVLSASECETVLSYMKGVTLNKISEPLSKVSQVLIVRSDENEWLYKRIQEVLLEVNKNHYQFEVCGMEDIQFLEYSFLNFMRPHFDCFTPSTSDRKLVISIQLSSTPYLGGNFFIRAAEGMVIASRNAGDAIVFPPYLQHFVKRIFFGKRASLVCRLRGKNDLR